MNAVEINAYFMSDEEIGQMDIIGFEKADEAEGMPERYLKVVGKYTLVATKEESWVSVGISVSDDKQKALVKKKKANVANMWKHINIESIVALLGAKPFQIDIVSTDSISVDSLKANGWSECESELFFEDISVAIESDDVKLYTFRDKNPTASIFDYAKRLKRAGIA